MNIFFIYKSLMDKNGEVFKVELVECDANELNASRFAKLYNLQIPNDLRDRICYNHIAVRVS